MFVCKICGNEVKQGQAFCHTCGADVVENYETVCAACGSKNGAGSRYCARCGGILQVMRKPVCAVCGAKNLPGAKFCVSCGAPIVLEAETHADEDMLDARKAKLRIDNMQRERMAAVDKEIAEKRAKTHEEKQRATQEIEELRAKNEAELDRRARMLDEYRELLNDMGAEDVRLLKKMSSSLKSYAAYYADPYSQIDEDDIEGETYVCPACGTINPLEATACTHCGRSKARALLLVAKGKLKQSPPIKRKQEIIEAPEQDLLVERVPTYDEFEKEHGIEKQQPQSEVVQEEEKKEAPQDFSGPSGVQPQHPYYPPYPPYPYPPQAYPYPACPPQPAAPSAPAYFVGPDGEPYQMPPIVQPVAFVPYVTQEQPLMQYMPQQEPQQVQVAKAMPAQHEVQPAQKKRK